jgi:polar amino acid transport system substrate-binding protein
MKKAIITLIMFQIFNIINVINAQQSFEILIPEYPPFTSSTNSEALWCELIQKAFKTENISVTWKTMPLNRMKAQVTVGESIAFVNSRLVLSEKELNQVLLSENSLIYADVVAFYSIRKYPNGIGLNRPEDLRDKYVGTILGTGSTVVMEKAGVRQSKAQDLKGLMNMQRVRRTDVFALADLTGVKALKEYMPDSMNDYKYESIYTSPIDLIFSKKHPKSKFLQKVFENGLNSIKEDGTYMTILKKYYPGGKINRNVLPVDMR